MYPFDRYRYYTAGNKIIAVSTYAGKTVRGITKCAEGDTFDMEKGKKLAAARCALKIANKRLNRAIRKENEANDAFYQAQRHLDKMTTYASDAWDAKYDAEDYLAEVLADM